jgi:DNA-binding Lrp family transcriptional regulator
MDKRMILDNNDLTILPALARDCRTSYGSISSQIGLTSKSVKARVKKMVRNGVIEKFVVRVNPAAFGYRTALVLIKTGHGIAKDDVIQRVKELRSCISRASYGEYLCGCPYHQKTIR